MDISADLKIKISKIKMLVMDVDGVMTDGRIFYGPEGNWCRQWSVRDGAGIVLLRGAGYKTGIITGAQSIDVDRRAEHLKIDYVFKGKSDKSPAYDEIKKLSGFKDEEISYIGDDIFDVPLLKQVGFAATVPGAIGPARECVDYITQANEGHGAIRELCELILLYGFYANERSNA